MLRKNVVDSKNGKYLDIRRVRFCHHFDGLKIIEIKDKTLFFFVFVVPC